MMIHIWLRVFIVLFCLFEGMNCHTPVSLISKDFILFPNVHAACFNFQCKVWLMDRPMDTKTDRHMDRQTPDKVIPISRSAAKYRWQKNDTWMSVYDKSTIHSRISGDWRWHIRISENSLTLPFLLSLKKRQGNCLLIFYQQIKVQVNSMNFIDFFY